MNSILNNGTITPGKKALCLGEVKVAATTINVVNTFGAARLSFHLVNHIDL